MFYKFVRFSLCGLGLWCSVTGAYAQFAPAAGVPGSTAMAADDPAFIDWGNNITVIRGPQQLGVDTLGQATAGTNESALGKAGESGSVSLGDGGSATYYFPMPVYDGPGYDFAVFENGFSDDFLELAFVEVSTDGIHFERFPAQSLTDTTAQVGTFGLLDTRKLDQLAGKYRALYGTPFDLEILKATSRIDVQQIHYVRITDVVGSLLPEYQQRDVQGRIVNDPWPTPFPTSGFDLDALGVIHQRSVSTENYTPRIAVQVSPTLVEPGTSLHFTPNEKGLLYILQPDGQLAAKHFLHGKNTLEFYPTHSGIWHWYWETDGVSKSGKFLVL